MSADLLQLLRHWSKHIHLPAAEAAMRWGFLFGLPTQTISSPESGGNTRKTEGPLCQDDWKIHPRLI